ncbi:MAG: hypothetical protein SF052_23835 [Bacteroidia bacterium]|nr:hypothetical protein [Bacteroidia bacterium]
MNFRVLLLVGLSMMGFLGCNQGNIDMDNAGDEALEVSIDELSYDMAPGQYQRIKLEKGRHLLKIKRKTEDGEKIVEADFRVVEGGLLNLAKTNYLVWTDLYGDPMLRESKLEEEWIEIDGHDYRGEFEKLDTAQFYIEKKWDYGLGEDFPDDLLGWEMGKEKYIIKRKLFRQEELIQAYNALVKEK